jgi:hypothetical protein
MPEQVAFAEPVERASLIDEIHGAVLHQPYGARRFSVLGDDHDAGCEILDPDAARDAVELAEAKPVEELVTTQIV